MAQSVLRLATGWTVRGWNTVGARFSAPVQPGPGVHPASHTMGTGSLSRGGGGKGPGRDVDPSLPSSADVKKRLYINYSILIKPSNTLDLRLL